MPRKTLSPMTTEPPAPTPGDRAQDDAVDTADAVDETQVDPGGATLAAEAGQNPTAPRQSLGRAGAVMASGTLVSRMLGLVRAALLTGVIGTTGYVADGFSAGQLAAQHVLPAHRRRRGQRHLRAADRAREAAARRRRVRQPDHHPLARHPRRRRPWSWLLLAPLAVRLFYNVDDAAALNLATVFAVICLPQIFFYGLYTILGQVLNAHGRFAGYMWAPAVANIVAIGGLVWFQRAGFPTSAAPADWTPEHDRDPRRVGDPVDRRAGPVSCSMPLRRIGFRYRPVWGIRGHGLGEVSTVAKWTFGSIVVSTLGFVVTSRVLTRATNLGVDAGDPVAGLAAFNPALLIAMLLHGLITVSLITALYTRLSEAAARGDSRRGDALPPPGAAASLGDPGARSRLRRRAGPLRRRHLVLQELLRRPARSPSCSSGLIWLAIPMAWTYLNDRVFYAHQMTWMTFRLQCVSTGVSTVGALIAATLVPSLTAFTLSIGQCSPTSSGAAVGFIGAAAPPRPPRAARHRQRSTSSWACRRWRRPWPCPGLIHTLLPDLGETRGVRGLVAGSLVLAVAGIIQLSVTWGVAHALGVREIGAALEPFTRRLRRR